MAPEINCLTARKDEQLGGDGRAWFNAPVLKTGDGDEPSLGSNPNPAAMKPVWFSGFLEGF